MIPWLSEIERPRCNAQVALWVWTCLLGVFERAVPRWLLFGGAAAEAEARAALNILGAVLSARQGKCKCACPLRACVAARRYSRIEALSRRELHGLSCGTGRRYVSGDPGKGRRRKEQRNIKLTRPCLVSRPCLYVDTFLMSGLFGDLAGSVPLHM